METLPDGDASGQGLDRVEFATYTRDSYTGFDYADQRFYASTYGRFLTPDRKGGNSTDPVSMNRYAYVGGDPVNRIDPQGTDCVFVNGGWCSALDSSGGCYDPGYGDPESGGGGGGGCPSFDPNVIMALEQSSLGPTLAAEAAAMGCAGYAPEQAAPPVPNCNPTGNPRIANNLAFVENNYPAALQVSLQQDVPVTWILGWAGVESGQPRAAGNYWGQLPQAQPGDNNFFGLTGGPWTGQAPCATTVTNGQSGSSGTFACFSSFYGSATAALSGVYGNALRIDAAAGQSATVAFYEVADLGYFSNPVAYGDPVGSAVRQATKLLDCLLASGH